MCGIITAGVILAGSSGLQMMEEQINSGETLYGIEGFTYGMDDSVNMDGSVISIFSEDDMDESENLVDAELGGMDEGILFWFMAITVLTLAALVPVMMIPELMALSNMAGQMISTGLLAGAVSVASVVKGGTAGAIGGAAASAGVAGAAGAGFGGQLKAAFTNPQTFSRMGQGIGTGLGTGLGQDVGAGMSLMPGSGPAVREASGGAHGMINSGVGCSSSTGASSSQMLTSDGNVSSGATNTGNGIFGNNVDADVGEKTSSDSSQKGGS